MMTDQTKKPSPVDWVAAALTLSYKLSLPVAKLNAYVLMGFLVLCAVIVYSGAMHGDVYRFAATYPKAAIGFRFLLGAGLLTLFAIAKAVGRRTPGLIRPMITVAVVCAFTGAVLVGRCTP
jgi:hypothetical protein